MAEEGQLCHESTWHTCNVTRVWRGRIATRNAIENTSTDKNEDGTIYQHRACWFFLKQVGFGFNQ